MKIAGSTTKLLLVTAINDTNVRDVIRTHANITGAQRLVDSIPTHRKPRIESKGFVIQSEQSCREIASIRYQESGVISIEEAGRVVYSDDMSGAWVQSWVWVDFTPKSDN